MARARRHPIFARLYALLSPSAEAAGVAAHRDELLAGLSGRVVDVGAGPGANFAHYPDSVSWVVAVEPEPFLARRARAAASLVGTRVDVVRADAEALPVADAWADAAVLSLVLCSVHVPERALEEIARALKPGGELRFYEHIRSHEPSTAQLQDRLDPVWTRLAGGCHCNRATDELLAASRFVPERMRRFDFPTRPWMRALAPHVLGAARAPGTAAERPED